MATYVARAMLNMLGTSLSANAAEARDEPATRTSSPTRSQIDGADPRSDHTDMASYFRPARLLDFWTPSERTQRTSAEYGDLTPAIGNLRQEPRKTSHQQEEEEEDEPQIPDIEQDEEEDEDYPQDLTIEQQEEEGENFQSQSKHHK